MAIMLPKASDLLKQSWNMFKQKLKILILIQLVPLAAIVPLFLLLGAVGFSSSKGSPLPFVEGEAVIWIAILAVVVFMIVLQIWAGIATLLAIDGQGEMPQFKAVFARSRPFIIPYLTASLLTGLIVFGGFILLIIPGIIFAIWYCFATYAVVLEDKRGMDALRTSKSYVQGNISQIFSKFVFLGLIALLVYAIPGMILDVIGLEILGDIYGGAVSLVFSPVAAIYAYLIYRALRDAKTGTLNEPPAIAEPVANP